MIRTLLERMSRNRSFKRRLPSAFGSTPLYVSPDAQLKVLRPGPSAFSPFLLRVAEAEAGPGKVVWDVGANIGVFTFACAARGAQVVACEADPFLAGLLERSAGLPANVGLDVTVVPRAISESEGRAELAIAARGRASNSLTRFDGRSQQGGVRETVLVETTTLDALLDSHPAPDVLKIDVEGAELAVLRGGAKLLRDCRPRIYVEVGGGQRSAVTALLREHGYRLHDAAKTDPEANEIEACSFDTLAVPCSPR